MQIPRNLLRRFEIADVFWRVTNERCARCSVVKKKNIYIYTTKTIYVQHRLREGRLLSKIFIMALKSTRRACKHWFFSGSFLQLSRHLEYNAPAVLARRVRILHYFIIVHLKCPISYPTKMAVDFKRFTHFRPCIDLHDGKVKQVCFKKYFLDII